MKNLRSLTMKTIAELRGGPAVALNTRSFRRLVAGGALAASLSLAAVSPGLALAQDDPGRSFGDTGYSVTDDSIWSFFSQFGGASTFGAPISREFTLFGKSTQLFQNAALQVQPDGSVQAMQLT